MALVDDRFQAKVAVGLPDECWPWQGARNSDGYGNLTRDGKNKKAHRLVLEWKLGRPIAPGKCACHSCDNPPCCNPSHIWEGTHRENMLDGHAKDRVHTVIQTPESLAKQRANTPRGDRNHMKKREYREAFRGSKNGNSKLTEAQVEEIRRLRSEGKLLREIAPQFGISLVLVSYICRGTVWVADGIEQRRAKPKRPGTAPKPLDRPKKGPRGEESGMSKLSAAQVAEIRALYAAGGITQAAIARRFGVSQGNISWIVTGQTRQHG